jgi:L-aspartate oxidase
MQAVSTSRTARAQAQGARSGALPAAPAHSIAQPLRRARPATSGGARGRRGRHAAVAVAADVNADAMRPRPHAATGAAPAARRAPSVRQFDYLVLGSGIAGLSYALKVAEYGRVAVVTKDFADEGCTQYAQGGVCAVLDAADSVDSHVHDTMVAGAFLNDRK